MSQRRIHHRFIRSSDRFNVFMDISLRFGENRYAACSVAAVLNVTFASGGLRFERVSVDDSFASNTDPRRSVTCHGD